MFLPQSCTALRQKGPLQHWGASISHSPVSSPGIRDVLNIRSHWAEQSGMVEPRRRIWNKGVHSVRWVRWVGGDWAGQVNLGLPDRVQGGTPG